MGVTYDLLGSNNLDILLDDDKNRLFFYLIRLLNEQKLYAICLISIFFKIARKVTSLLWISLRTSLISHDEKI